MCFCHDKTYDTAVHQGLRERSYRREDYETVVKAIDTWRSQKKYSDDTIAFKILHKILLDTKDFHPIQIRYICNTIESLH